MRLNKEVIHSLKNINKSCSTYWKAMFLCVVSIFRGSNECVIIKIIFPLVVANKKIFYSFVLTSGYCVKIGGVDIEIQFTI